MKRRLLPLLLIWAGSPLMAQIPNPSFEVWKDETRNLPLPWLTFGNVTKVSGPQGGSAVRLQPDPQSDGAPGAVLYGIPPERSMTFGGGIPMSGRPDSVNGWFRFGLTADDSAVFIVQLRKNGTVICDQWIKFTGNSAWQRRAFKLNYTAAGDADTMVIGIACTNFTQDTIRLQSWIEADLIGVSGASVTIPNNSFETWTDVTKNYPSRWTADGDFSQPATVYRSTAAARGFYSVQIRNYTSGGMQNGGYTRTSRTESPNDNDWGPAFPVSAREDSLFFYAKYQPQNGDSGRAEVVMFKNGNQIAYSSILFAGTNNSWVLMNVPIGYWSMETPDSASIAFGSFDWQSMDGEPKGNSILTIDEVSFTQPYGLDAKRFEDFGISMHPNPASKHVSLDIPGGLKTGEYIELRDISGRLIQQTAQTELSVAGLPAGTYLLRVIRHEGSARGKLIVQP
jgi:hypothetical protein